MKINIKTDGKWDEWEQAIHKMAQECQEETEKFSQTAIISYISKNVICTNKPHYQSGLRRWEESRNVILIIINSIHMLNIIDNNKLITQN